jgi:hypothetical protein
VIEAGVEESKAIVVGLGVGTLLVRNCALSEKREDTAVEHAACT